MTESHDDQDPSRQLGAFFEAPSERLLRLRRRVDRRESILPADAPDGVDDISDPWSIKIEPQLIHWVEQHHAKMLFMIVTLREDHDASKELLEQMKIEEQRVEKAVKIARKAQVDSKQTKSKAYRLREKIMNLQAELNTAIEALVEHRDAETVRRIDLTEATGPSDPHRRPVTRDEQLSNLRASPAPTTTTTLARKSDKHPDPKEFTGDSDGPSWTEWYSKMLNKLHINADRWNTLEDQARYAINRVGGDSQKGVISHIIAYRLSNLDYFKTLDMVFEVLRGGNEDKNLKNNSRRTYIGLKQRSIDSFAMFFFEFRKLGSILR